MQRCTLQPVSQRMWKDYSMAKGSRVDCVPLDHQVTLQHHCSKGNKQKLLFSHRLRTQQYKDLLPIPSKWTFSHAFTETYSVEHADLLLLIHLFDALVLGR